MCSTQHEVFMPPRSPIANVFFSDINEFYRAKEEALWEGFGQTSMQTQFPQELKTSRIESLTCVNQQAPSVSG